MRIFYIADAESIHTQRWVNFFANGGHQIYLFTPNSPILGYSQPIEIIRFKKIFKQNRSISFIINLFPEIVTIFWLLHKFKPDIVHIHYVNSDALAGVLTRFRPVVLTVWGSDILVAPKESILNKYLAKLVLKRVNCITCDAEHIKKEMITLGSVPEVITIIIFGVDVKKFAPRLKDVHIIKKFNCTDSTIIISLRSLNPIYSIDTLISSIPTVVQKHENVIFFIAGKGSEEQNLRILAENLGISRYIKFIGQLSSEELPNFLNTADIYVSSSLSDAGLSASTAEAMASGLPVIITEFGDNSLWVQEGKGGYLFPKKNAQILAEKIIHLIEHPELRKEFGATNRNIIEEKNNYYREMEKMEKIYENLVKKK